MSVIHDALKTAQREKQNRESGFQPGGTPLIVPKRGTKSGEAFSWKNTVTIAIASVVIVGASWSLWVRMENLRPRAVRTVPVATVPVEIPEVQTAETPAPPAPADPVATRVARDLERIAATTSGTSDAAAPRSSAPRPAGRRTPPGMAPSQTAAAGRAADSATPAVPLREPLQTGRLRIAVEQPREGEAARLFAAGVAPHRAGDLEAARSAYERVLVLAPNDVDALNNFGVLLAAVRDLDRAEAMLRRAVRIAPRHTGAWNNLGTVLAQRGQAADAIAAFQQALALDPQHQGARVSLAQQFLAIAAPEKAREVLEEVLAANPSMPEAHYALGQAYEMEKDWAGAIRSYEAFVRVAPARLAADVGRVQQRIQMLAARVK